MTRIEVMDYDAIFNDGVRIVFVNGKSIGWVPIPVF